VHKVEQKKDEEGSSMLTNEHEMITIESFNGGSPLLRMNEDVTNFLVPLETPSQLPQ
jgi:hypothetical protein